MIEIDSYLFLRFLFESNIMNTTEIWNQLADFPVRSRCCTTCFLYLNTKVMSSFWQHYHGQSYCPSFFRSCYLTWTAILAPVNYLPNLAVNHDTWYWAARPFLVTASAVIRTREFILASQLGGVELDWKSSALRNNYKTTIIFRFFSFLCGWQSEQN